MRKRMPKTETKDVPTFEHLPKTETVNLRIPLNLLKDIETRAKSKGVSRQRFMRHALERAIAGRL